MSQQPEENAQLETPELENNMSTEDLNKRVKYLEEKVKELANNRSCECDPKETDGETTEGKETKPEVEEKIEVKEENVEEPEDIKPEPAEDILEEEETISDQSKEDVEQEEEEEILCTCEDCQCAEGSSEDEKETEPKKPTEKEYYYQLQGEDASEVDEEVGGKTASGGKIYEQEMDGEDEDELIGREPRLTPQKGIWALEQISILLGHHSVDDILKIIKENKDMKDRIEQLEGSSQDTIDPASITRHIEELENEVAALSLKAAEVQKLKKNLANKADINELTTKVDCEEFTSAVQNISIDIQEIIENLADQVQKWERREAEMKQSLEQMLDSQMMNIKEYLQVKLYRYNMKLNQLAKILAEQSSLGAIGRPQLLRGQSCVACGAGIVMRCEGGVRAPIRALPPRSMRLYPKQGKAPLSRGGAGEPSQNYVNQQPSKESAEFFESLTPRCGGEGVRHCGGSHTITEAPQRIIRRGNFHQDFQAKREGPSPGVAFAKSTENSPKSL